MVFIQLLIQLHSHLLPGLFASTKVVFWLFFSFPNISLLLPQVGFDELTAEWASGFSVQAKLWTACRSSSRWVNHTLLWLFCSFNFFLFCQFGFFFFKLLPKLDLRRVQDVDLFTTVLICSRFPSYCSKMTVWSQQVIHTRPLLSAGGNLPHHQWSRAPDALPPPLLGEELTRLVSSLGRSRPLLISTASGHRPSTTSSFFILLFHFSYFFFSSSQLTVNCQLFVSRSSSLIVEPPISSLLNCFCVFT